ncbi:KilA-N domain-containing protein [Thauera aromatica]|uniref:KilA-N domain protein n=1 Tax=Thauera aromatica K172 TaxID=44139 RepID=A0A2R4BJL6_THAAR|nr:KilA-N domain-containing protein [Thauera aromatica]AVR87374.1 KilA-N domain protein [Thauera aromatica K172]
MQPKHQLSLALIQHQVNNSVISQRASDGYINATALCQAAGKQFKDYMGNKSTQEFLTELSAETGLQAQLVEKSLVEKKQALVETFPGAPSTGGGSWVHPQVAIHLGQWASGKFAVQVSKWVHEWMSGKGAPNRMPYHIRRHMLNLNQVPAGYFSVLQEMTFLLIAPLDQSGYELPERMVPDISMGRFLCKHLRDSLGIDTDSLPTYLHRYPDGRRVSAKLYPNNVLAEFRKLIQERWLPENAARYFSQRDPAALPHLDALILALPMKSAANDPRLGPPSVRRQTK